MKFVKQSLCMLLLICLIIPIIPSSNIDAAVRLNKTKLTLELNEIAQLKVLGKHTRPTWTSSNNDVACVTSKGKVVARKAGKATITCKIKKKKYKCTVTVKKPVNTDYGKKITYDLFETSDSFISIIHNKNNCPVQISVALTFYNNEGNWSYQSNYKDLLIGKKCNSVMEFDKPRDYYSNELRYSSSKLLISVGNVSKYQVSTADMITTVASATADNKVICDVCNTSKKTTDSYQISCLYFSGGKVVALESMHGTDLKPDSTKSITFNAPKDLLLNDIAFDYFKIYVDYATHYKDIY